MTAPSPEQVAGQELRRLRTARRWSQEEVTQRLGYPWHQSAMAKTEAAQRPLRLNELVALCQLYGVTLASLLTALPAMTDRELEEQATAKLARLEDRVARIRAVLDENEQDPP